MYNAEVLIAIQEQTGATLSQAKTIANQDREAGSDAWPDMLECIREAENEAAIWRDDPDNFDNEKTQEQEAGDAFQDKLDMYRNEY